MAIQVILIISIVVMFVSLVLQMYTIALAYRATQQAITTQVKLMEIRQIRDAILAERGYNATQDNPEGARKS